MAQIAQRGVDRRTATATTRRTHANPWRKYLPTVIRHAVLILVSILFIFPFYWMVITALKENTRVFTYPIEWWPNPIRWENFGEAINYSGFPFFLYLRNSLFLRAG